MNVFKPDLCVIGGTAAALTMARKATALGLEVVLIQGPRDNLDYLVSKSFLPLAFQGQDFDAARLHYNEAIDKLRKRHVPMMLEEDGFKVLQGHTKFLSQQSIAVGDDLIEPRYIVVTAGSESILPAIEGLNPDHVYTPENIFGISHLPKHLAIYGSGNFAAEAADVFSQLGSKVTLVCEGPFLLDQDRDAANHVRENLIEKGARVLELTNLYNVEHTQDGVKLATNREGILEIIEATYLLVTTEKRASFAGMDLSKADIATDKTGIATDEKLRTSAPRIFAIGPVAGWPLSTYPAEQQAEIVLKQIAYRSPFAKLSSEIVPKVIMTRPELCSIGWAESEAAQKYGAKKIHVVSGKFEHNDYAASGATNPKGFMKVILHKNGKILGVHIVHERSAEIIALWCLAIREDLDLGSMSKAYFPIPSLAELSRRAATDAQKILGRSIWRSIWIRLLRFLP